MAIGKRKFHPNQCPDCIFYFPARRELDPGMQNAPWTKRRCGRARKYWWEFNAEYLLEGEPDRSCKHYSPEERSEGE